MAYAVRQISGRESGSGAYPAAGEAVARGDQSAGLNFHDSRHSAITRLARRLQVLDLARQVGVRDLQTLMTYYNEPAEERAKRLR